MKELSNRVKAGILFFFLMTIPFFASDVSALERFGYIGVSYLAPVVVDPTTEWGDQSIGIDLGYFIEERWAISFLSGIGLKGEKRVDLRIGPQLYFVRSTGPLLPYAVTRFIYSLDPSNDVGWSFGGGLEFNLRQVTGLDNLRTFVEFGISQLFVDQGPNVILLDIPRTGLSWHF